MNIVQLTSELAKKLYRQSKIEVNRLIAKTIEIITEQLSSMLVYLYFQQLKIDPKLKNKPIEVFDKEEFYDNFPKRKRIKKPLFSHFRLLLY